MSAVMRGSVVPLILSLAAGASAQLGVEWVEFEAQPSALGPGVAAISDPNTDADYAVGDLDQDGWLDVVVARKSAGSQLPKRTDVLLMNVGGVLTDQTAAYAQASDVPGDLGFLTPTVHTAVKLADLDGDGWLDVVFSASLSDGDPKALSHPRIYRNLGDDAGGAWLGLVHEGGRIPQLFTVGGLAVAPRFAQFDVGDVGLDGAPDMYFVDHDGTETAISEPSAWDLNDRLLVNDGSGWFIDASSSALTVAQLNSGFGRMAQIVDLNADGLNDIVKLSFLEAPKGLFAFYNNPAAPGTFAALGVTSIGASSAIDGARIGDLNNDALLDFAIADDGADGFQLGTGYNAQNKLLFGPKTVFQFVSGGDDGWGRNVVLSDLDLNGWNDVLITDVDMDLPGCFRRMHIYHNTGTVAGQMDLVIKEEAELATGSTGAGWKGVVGLGAPDLKGTYAVAPADFDNDGDPDLLIGRCAGTSYHANTTLRETCQADLGFGGPGSVGISVCGDDLRQPGSLATLDLSGAAPGDAIAFALSLSNAPTPFKGGTLVPVPVLLLVSGIVADGNGGFSAAVPGGGGPSVHLFLQAIVKHGTIWQLSNALDVLIGS